MKKYRCPKCEATFTGKQYSCPTCGVKLHYHDEDEQKNIVKEESVETKTFNFSDPDLIKDENKVVPTSEFLDEEEELEEKPVVNTPTNLPVNKDLYNGESFFDGRLIQKIGWTILAGLLTLVTVFIALPWAACMIYRWETKHTVICGHRLYFDGKGIQLFGRYMLWFLLTIITVGIFSLWVAIFFKKWKTKHIIFEEALQQ